MGERITGASQRFIRRLKMMAVLCLGLALLGWHGGPAHAAASTLELWYREGGYTHAHIAQARRWLASRTTLVIRDWQVSAAAIQVVYYKRMGGRVCYGRSGFNADPALYFHVPQSRGVPSNSLASHIGASNAAKLGRLSGNRMKRVHPSVFGIPACPPGLKARTRTLARPSLMRW